MQTGPGRQLPYCTTFNSTTDADGRRSIIAAKHLIGIDRKEAADGDLKWLLLLAAPVVPVLLPAALVSLVMSLRRRKKHEKRDYALVGDEKEE